MFPPIDTAQLFAQLGNYCVSLCFQCFLKRLILIAAACCDWLLYFWNVLFGWAVESRQHCRLSICIYWLSFTNTESEANQNNNLMMRRAGLSSRKCCRKCLCSKLEPGGRWLVCSRLMQSWTITTSSLLLGKIYFSDHCWSFFHCSQCTLWEMKTCLTNFHLLRLLLTKFSFFFFFNSVSFQMVWINWCCTSLQMFSSAPRVGASC